MTRCRIRTHTHRIFAFVERVHTPPRSLVCLTIECTDRHSTHRQTENWRGILARVQSLVNALLTATSACYTKGGLNGRPLRVSNEGLPRPRVARAQETTQTTSRFLPPLQGE